MKMINEEEHRRFVAKHLECKNKLTAGAVTRGSLIKRISKVDTALRDCAAKAKDETEQAAASDFSKKPSVFAHFLSLFQKKRMAV